MLARVICCWLACLGVGCFSLTCMVATCFGLLGLLVLGLGVGFACGLFDWCLLACWVCYYALVAERL